MLIIEIHKDLYGHIHIRGINIIHKVFYTRLSTNIIDSISRATEYKWGWRNCLVMTMSKSCSMLHWATLLKIILKSINMIWTKDGILYGRVMAAWQQGKMFELEVEFCGLFLHQLCMCRDIYHTFLGLSSSFVMLRIILDFQMVFLVLNKFVILNYFCMQVCFYYLNNYTVVCWKPSHFKF